MKVNARIGWRCCVYLRTCSPLTLIFALACWTGLQGSALAQTAPTPPPGATTTGVFTPGNWTLTPFAGVGFGGDLDGATGTVGAAAGYVLNERVSLEGELSVLPSRRASGLVPVDTSSWTLTANALYHFAGRVWLPYGVVGLGLGHGKADVSSTGLAGQILDSSSTNFVVNLGGGVERRINDRLGFRGDLRYQFGGDFVPSYWRLGAGVTFGLRNR